MEFGETFGINRPMLDPILRRWTAMVRGRQHYEGGGPPGYGGIEHNKYILKFQSLNTHFKRFDNSKSTELYSRQG